ncbi:MAG: penicillin acylase family protein [Chitinophagaceae bacterium]
MKKLLLITFLLPIACSPSGNDPDIKKYEEQAARVTIIRDKWGVPHVYGKTDADAVFGLMYAQCEESFERVEKNYIEKLGRQAEADGEAYLYNDLLMRLLYDTSAAITDYKNSPAWLKKLLNAFADGVNYYLLKHPETKPVLLKRFEPWFPLLFTDGGYTAMQTGGLEMEDIKRLYTDAGPSSFIIDPPLKKDPMAIGLTGSNAFAIAPSKTVSKNALLYINPHVSFYFRTEMHMVSEEGLNTYGAVTWGQFFVFQGFNENCGWMHTSSMADAADLYEEKIVRKNNSIFYEYDGSLRSLQQRQQVISYKKNSNILPRSVTTYYTHHGPVVGSRNDKWLSLKENNRSLNGLIQSWQRTKAKGYDEFEKTMELHANISTNTMYADNKGNIAYWHGNFIPKRNPAFDWGKPVDGAISATEWQGPHAMSEMIQTHNPKQGWAQNCNSTPFNVSGINSIRQNDYPSYMAPDGENFRSLLAIKEIEKENNFTLDKLIALGYNNYLGMFDSILPPLLQAYDALALSDPGKQSLKEPIETLRAWDKKSSVSSVATTLAVEWAYHFISSTYYKVKHEEGTDQTIVYTSLANNTSAKQLLDLLTEVVGGLQQAYGNWKVPWGDINRYQRVNTGQSFDDSKSSMPVGLASAFFGSLPAFEAVWHKTNKGYGTAGNSFVAAVEFGSRIKAKSVITGGQYFDPASKHFTDQAGMYIEGRFKDILFYKEDVLRNVERSYHPGQ